MKKITTLLIALTAMLCVSCDEDSEVAYYLEGEWEGNMGMYYVYNDRYGSVEYDAQYTNIRFFRQTLTSGYGDQVDFYRTGPYRWQSFSFRWRVQDGNIYLYYDYANELDCVIYDYYLDYNYLGGRIGNTRIRLTKLDDFKWSDYNNYNNGYSYSYYNSYYSYAKTRAGESVTDSVQTGKIVKRGSRFSN